MIMPLMTTRCGADGAHEWFSPAALVRKRAAAWKGPEPEPLAMSVTVSARMCGEARGSGDGARK